MADIPLAVREAILVESLHRCCICHEPDVQVHHIEGRGVLDAHPPDKLIVLCPNCHSKAEQVGGHGRSYTAGELRKYRDQSYDFVEKFHRKAVQSASFQAAPSRADIPPRVSPSQRPYYVALDEAYSILDMPLQEIDESSRRTIVKGRELVRNLLDQIMDGKFSRMEDREIVADALTDVSNLEPIHRIREAQAAIKRTIQVLRG